MSAEAVFVPVDQSARTAFEQKLDAGYVVEAGAGTGKTTLIVSRLAKLLSKFSLPELAAITFSESAGSELIERLRGLLEAQLVHAPLGDFRRRTQSLNEIFTAPIGTIHSFASDIIRKHSFSLNLTPDFDHIDEIDEREMVWSRFAELFDRPNPSRDQLFKRFVELQGRINAPAQLAQELYRYRDLTDTIPHYVLQFDAAAEASSLWEAFAELWRHCQLKCVQPDEDKYYHQTQAKFARHSRPPASDAERTALAMALAKFKKSKSKQANWASKSDHAAWRESVDVIEEQAKALLLGMRRKVLHRLLKLLVDDLSLIEQEKIRAGRIGFQDQLLFACKLLKSPDVLEMQRGRIKRIIIDEFQDTDPLQVEIALRLAGLIDESGAKTRPVTGYVSVVGDRKQSIYRFRRADARTFLRAAQQIQRTGGSLSLSQNFRSSEGVINFCNGLFAPLWKEGYGGEGGYEPLVALPSRPQPSPAPPVVIIEPLDQEQPEKRSAPDWRILEARAAAKYLAELIADPETKVWDKVSNQLRRAEYKDVTLLFRRLTNVDVYTAALDDAGIPYTMTNVSNLFNDSLVKEIVAALAAVDNPLDRQAVVTALRSRLFAVSDPEIYKWHLAGGGALDYRQSLSDLPERVNFALQTLRELNRERTSRTAHWHLCRLIELTKLNETLALDRHYALLSQRLNHLLNLAFDSRQSQGRILRTFRRWLARIQEGRGDAAGNLAPDPGAEGVRIMSIHAAKGLEFPIVGLIDCGGERRGNTDSVKVLPSWDPAGLAVSVSSSDDSGVHFTTEGWESAAEFDNLQDEQESLRLLYVALTRARDHLFIPLFQNNPMYDKAALHGKYLHMFAHSLPPFTPATSGFFRRLDYETVEADTGRRVPPTDEDIQGGVRLLNELAHSLDGRPALLAKAISDLPRIVRPSEAVIVSETADAAAAADTSGMQIGSAVHLYLAACPLSREIDEDLLARCADQQNVPVPKIRPLILSALESEVWAEITAATWSAREMPVSANLEAGYMNGIVDAVWRSPDGGLCIVDWKTGGGTEGHLEQIRLYADALSRIVGAKIARACLYYCSNGLLQEIEVN